MTVYLAVYDERRDPDRIELEMTDEEFLKVVNPDTVTGDMYDDPDDDWAAYTLQYEMQAAGPEYPLDPQAELERVKIGPYGWVSEGGSVGLSPNSMEEAKDHREQANNRYLLDNENEPQGPMQ